MEYMCAKFGVVSSSRFSFRERTDTQTHSHRCHWSPCPRIGYGRRE